MKQRALLILVFLGGVVIGVVATLAAARFGKGRPTTYVLREDLDLAKTYFFNDPPPVRGVIAAGSKLDVEFRYSRADYVVFRSVIDRETLMRISTRVPDQQATR